MPTVRFPVFSVSFERGGGRTFTGTTVKSPSRFRNRTARYNASPATCRFFSCARRRHERDGGLLDRKQQRQIFGRYVEYVSNRRGERLAQLHPLAHRVFQFLAIEHVQFFGKMNGNVIPIRQRFDYFSRAVAPPCVRRVPINNRNWINRFAGSSPTDLSTLGSRLLTTVTNCRLVR